jgi:transcriptional regulator with XRE-family HTH domain
MRSKIAQRIIDNTPKGVQIFTDLYTDLIFRINDLIEEQGYSKKEFAAKMGKSPSELSRMLGGKHNPTLKSIALISAVLDEELIYIPQRKPIIHSKGKSLVMTTYVNRETNYANQNYATAIKSKDLTEPLLAS